MVPELSKSLDPARVEGQELTQLPQKIFLRHSNLEYNQYLHTRNCT